MIRKANIGDLERFNLVVYRAISTAVTGDPLPITTTINGVIYHTNKGRQPHCIEELFKVNYSEE